MAILKLADGTIYQDMLTIESKLNALNIQIEKLPLNQYLSHPVMSRSLQNIFTQDILDLSQKQQILQALNPKFTTCKHISGYTRYDLILINPTSPQLYNLLAQGSRPRAHTEDEVLYLLGGECIFGFSHSDGLIELMLQAQEYVKVPAGIRHWFSLSASLQMKAVRYFTHLTELVPKYNQPLH